MEPDDDLFEFEMLVLVLATVGMCYSAKYAVAYFLQALQASLLGGA